MADNLLALIVVSFILPVLGPWIGARVATTKAIWLGYLAGVFIVIALLVYAGATDLIKGERLAVTFTVFAIALAPISVLGGLVSTIICHVVNKRRRLKTGSE